MGMVLFEGKRYRWMECSEVVAKRQAITVRTVNPKRFRQGQECVGVAYRPSVIEGVRPGEVLLCGPNAWNRVSMSNFEISFTERLELVERVWASGEFPPWTLHCLRFWGHALDTGLVTSLRVLASHTVTIALCPHQPVPPLPVTLAFLGCAFPIEGTHLTQRTGPYALVVVPDADTAVLVHAHISDSLQYPCSPDLLVSAQTISHYDHIVVMDVCKALDTARAGLIALPTHILMHTFDRMDERPRDMLMQHFHHANLARLTLTVSKFDCDGQSRALMPQCAPVIVSLCVVHRLSQFHRHHVCVLDHLDKWDYLLDLTQSNTAKKMLLITHTASSTSLLSSSLVEHRISCCTPGRTNPDSAVTITDIGGLGDVDMAAVDVVVIYQPPSTIDEYLDVLAVISQPWLCEQSPPHTTSLSVHSIFTMADRNMFPHLESVLQHLGQEIPPDLVPTATMV